MTFLNLKTMLAQDVNRSDKEMWYPVWINRALRKIQTDASFACMKSRQDVVIPAGSSSVLLPTRFKELYPEQFPVAVISPPGSGGIVSEIPCEVTSREDIVGYRISSLLPVRQASFSGSLVGYPVWTELTGSGWTLNIADPASETLTFRVAHHAFLPELAADSDSNYLTLNYPDLVENKVKGIAFMAVNDPIGAQFEAMATKLLNEAVLDDKRRASRGRVMRMGG